MLYQPPIGAVADAPYIDGDPQNGTPGSPVPASAIEHPQRELINLIQGAGLTPDQSDLNQLGKAIAQYLANGDAYADSGVANAYVLSVIGSRQAPTSYADQMRVRFTTINPSMAGASTVNVAGLGVKAVKDEFGEDVLPGKIDGRTELIFDLPNDWFELISLQDAQFGIGQTWQELTASRASGVTYTNLTEKPILVAMRCSGGTVNAIVDGVELSAGTPSNAQVSVLVPPGSAYILTIAGGAIGNWAELR
jgi:hypothetical protein